MNFRNMNISNAKIFKSLISLEYKDSKLESKYQNLSKQSQKDVLNYFTLILIFFGMFLTTLEGVLYYTQGERKAVSLQWNFYFVAINLILSLFILFLSYFKDTIDNKILKYFTKFIIHFCFSNFFISLLSVTIVYLNLGIEIVSFVFLLHTITDCILAFFLHRSFLTTFINISICVLLDTTLLLSIHVKKVIIYFITIHTGFVVIVLAFVYLYEYMTKKFVYSFLKLAEEKEYFLDTLDFLNISYFSSRNRNLKKMRKMDFLFQNMLNEKANSLQNENFFNNNITLNSIEEIIKENLVSVENLPKEIQKHFLDAKSKNKFKFKKIINFLKSKEENRNFFQNFNKVCVLKIKNKNSGEDHYIQLFLKIKIKITFDSKKENSNYDDDYSENKRKNLFYKDLNVKLEGVFLDITQSYIKKDIQLNSLKLTKYIHEIKSPLCFLEQMVGNYKNFLKDKMKIISNDIKEKNYENINLDSINIKDFSHNLKTISKYIFDVIENIREFTHKQNCFDSVEHNHKNKYTQVDIRKLIGRCLEFFKIFTKFNTNKQNIKVYSQVEGHVPHLIFTNKKALKHVFLKLLANSMNFTHNGEIKIVCTLKSKLEQMKDRKYVEINVIDTGIGIDEENMGNLAKDFEPSTNLHRSGFGLSIIIDQLATINSKLSFSSVKNKGSNFSFEIPIEKKNFSDISVLHLTPKEIKCHDCEGEKSFEEVKFSTDTTEVNKLNSNLQFYNNIICEAQTNAIDDDDSNFDTKTVFFEKPFNTTSFREDDDYKNICNIISRCSFKEGQIYNNYNSDDDISYRKNYKLQIQKVKFDNEEIVISELNYKKRNSVIINPVLKPMYSVNFSNNTTLPYKPSHFKNVSFSNNFNLDEIKSETIFSLKQQHVKSEIKLSALIVPERPSFKKQSCVSDTKLNLKSRLNIEKFCKILIIDDDPTYLRQIITQIKSVGTDLKLFIVSDSANDSIEGLNKIYTNLKEKNEFYDLIFIDENMPFMRGSTFTKLYKELLTINGFYKIPFVNISSEICQSNENSKFFDYYLGKPCKKKDMKCLFTNFYKNK